MTTSKSNLTINPQRLWDALMDTAKFGATPKGGIKRLTVSDEDKKVRDWFKAQCEALGCKVAVDSVGNMFALRPGKNNALQPIAEGWLSTTLGSLTSAGNRSSRRPRASGAFSISLPPP